MSPSILPLFSSSTLLLPLLSILCSGLMGPGSLQVTTELDPSQHLLLQMLLLAELNYDLD